MKKLFLTLACCCFAFATFVPAPVHAQGTMDNKMAMKDKDGTVKMVSGKMMVMTNGSWTAMTTTTTMANGTKVMTDGTVMMKDGKKKMLKDGDCVKPDGMMKKM